jgi:tRNA(fMet)-specific endonuclease VapC
MPLYMLDTSICVELLRGRAARVFARMRRRSVEDIALSTLVVSELQYGVARSARPAHHAALLLQFCAPLAILPFDQQAAAAYGPLRAALERKGARIGPLDALIAAHALSGGMTLITNNEREFRRVAGLKVENWLVP